MRIYALLVLCVLLWSGNFVLGRFVSDAIEPLELAFFRWLGVLIAGLPFLLLHVRKIARAVKEHFFVLALLSMLGIAGFNTLLYVGLHYTAAINALLINSSIPLLIVFLSFVFLGLPIRAVQVIGIAFSTAGVAFLVLKGDWRALSALQFNQGDFWVIASSLCWASYSVLVKFRPKSLNSFEFFMTTVLLGVVMLFPFYWAQGYTLEREYYVLKHYYWAIAYVSLLTSMVSYYLWHLGIARIGADKTGQFTHLMPLFGSALAYLFLGERLEWYHLGGAVLIGYGLYLCLFVRQKNCSKI